MKPRTEAGGAIEQHLAIGKGGPDTCLRIHFYTDDEQGKYVVAQSVARAPASPRARIVTLVQCPPCPISTRYSNTYSRNVLVSRLTLKGSIVRSQRLT